MLLGPIGHILHKVTPPRLKEVIPNLVIGINNREEQIKSKSSKGNNKRVEINELKTVFTQQRKSTNSKSV